MLAAVELTKVPEHLRCFIKLHGVKLKITE